MRTYAVVPGVGVEPVRLGMRREDVRRAMGENPVSFNKAGTSRHEVDAFHQNGFQVFYEGDEPRVEFVELSSGCGFDATYRGKSAFTTSAADLVEFIAQEVPFDESDPELAYTFIFPALELSLWRPAKPETRDDPEGQFFMTIGVGVRGYYSNSRAQKQ